MGTSRPGRSTCGEKPQLTCVEGMLSTGCIESLVRDRNACAQRLVGSLFLDQVCDNAGLTLKSNHVRDLYAIWGYLSERGRF